VTPHQIEFEGGLLKLKISFQEGTGTSREQGGAKKEGYPEDLYNRMGQGKSSLVSIVGNQVTLKETVDIRGKRTLTISKGKGLHTPDKGPLTKMVSTPLAV
jgi:hypothetical protein